MQGLKSTKEYQSLQIKKFGLCQKRKKSGDAEVSEKCFDQVKEKSRSFRNRNSSLWGAVEKKHYRKDQIQK